MYPIRTARSIFVSGVRLSVRSYSLNISNVSTSERILEETRDLINTQGGQAVAADDDLLEVRPMHMGGSSTASAKLSAQHPVLSLQCFACGGWAIGHVIARHAEACQQRRRESSYFMKTRAASMSVRLLCHKGKDRATGPSRQCGCPTGDFLEWSMGVRPVFPSTDGSVCFHRGPVADRGRSNDGAFVNCPKSVGE